MKTRFFHPALPLTIATLSLLHASCADDLSSSLDGQEAAAQGTTEESDPQESGTVRTVDATDEEAWVYLDLESGDNVSPTEPLDSTEWDLGMRRYVIALNGGVSGTGGVEAVRLEGAYEDITQAPTDGYVTDVEDGEDDDEDPDHALSSGETPWFAYDQATHSLTPESFVYVIRSVEGGYFKLAFLGYYNDAGSSGHVRIRFEAIDGPEGEN